MRALACLLLAVVLVAGATSAAEGPGVTLRELGFASFVTAESEDLAAYSADTERATLELRAASLHVTIWTASYAEVGTTPMPTLVEVTSTRVEYDLRDVVVTLADGDHSGWLGVRDLAAGTLAGSSGASLSPSLSSRLGAGAGGTRREDPAQPQFLEPRDGPHLSPSGFDAIDASGRHELRFAGMDVQMTARENDTRLETGWRHADASDPVTRVTWASLAPSADATLSLHGLREVTAQAQRARIEWTGQARAVDAAGAVVLLDAGTAAIEADATGLLFQGPAQGSATTGSGRAPIGPSLASPWSIGVFLVLIAGAIAGGAVWGRSRADPLRSWDPEDLVALAHDASQAGDHDEARRWIKRARARAPESRRLALDEAYLEEQAGDVARARAILAELAAVGDPDGAWMFARVLLREGAHVDDVEPWILQALDARPVLALELRDDRALASLEARPAISRAMRAAIAKLDASR